MRIRMAKALFDGIDRTVPGRLAGRAHARKSRESGSRGVGEPAGGERRLSSSDCPPLRTPPSLDRILARAHTQASLLHSPAIRSRNYRSTLPLEPKKLTELFQRRNARRVTQREFSHLNCTTCCLHNTMSAGRTERNFTFDFPEFPPPIFARVKVLPRCKKSSA